jgi:hypothetical protein
LLAAFTGEAGTPSKIKPKKIGDAAEGRIGGCGDGVADHSCQAALRRTRRQDVIW